MIWRILVLVAVQTALGEQQAEARILFERVSVASGLKEPIEAGIWYPSRDGSLLPLVVISHGTGGGYQGHSDTARSLAEAGFVTAALTHPGDNFRDNSRAFAIWRRPAHLKRLTDYMLTSWHGRQIIDASRIGAFGFSAGGFTVLVAAGGKPDLRLISDHCRKHPTFFDCRIAGKGPGGLLFMTPWIKWTHDSRLRAIAVAAPALGFTFGPNGLSNVKVPVQLWRAEADEILPHPFYAEAVRRALRPSPEYIVVPNAAHFDFLEPCAPDFSSRNTQVCASRPGFDRSLFHTSMNAKIVQFFRDKLKRPEPAKRARIDSNPGATSPVRR